MFSNNVTTNCTTVYIGMDAHTSNYNVSFLNSETGEVNYENKLPANDQELVKYVKKMIQRHYSKGDYHFIVGYEAGYTGYTTARYLQDHGIDCVVMAPNTIKRSAKEKRYKNDVADARLIAQTLLNKDYSEVKLPTQDEESLKRLLRHRDRVVKEITRIKNELAAILYQKGFRSLYGKWSENYLKDVIDFIDKDQQDLDIFVLEDLLDELIRQNKRLDKIEAKIDEVINSNQEYQEKVKNLSALKGVSTVVAINMISTAQDITRFETADQFANYLGLTPGDNSSGKKNQKLGITKNGNPRIRALLIQAAQTYARGSAYFKTKTFLKGLQEIDSKLVEYVTRAYERLHKKFKHLRDDLNKAYNVCVCAIARELACFIWGILSGNID